MSVAPKISLDQWRALQAVVESGGYAQAAEALHKSQSTVTYSVQQIQRLLDVKVFEIRGRKAVLTDAGQVLYRRARTLLEEAAQLERGAAEMAQDWQPEIRIAVDVIFPTWLLLEALEIFARERPATRLEVYETVMSGTWDMLSEGRVDFAIGHQEMPDASSRALIRLTFIPVASPSHPLHLLGRKVSARDLRRHRRILIRDTSAQRKTEVSGVDLRWTVSNKATALRALTMGLGFAWVPEDTIAAELREGSLKRLPLTESGARTAQLFLAHSDPEFPGRDAARLADILTQHVIGSCRRAKAKMDAKKR